MEENAQACLMQRFGSGMPRSVCFTHVVSHLVVRDHQSVGARKWCGCCNGPNNKLAQSIVFALTRLLNGLRDSVLGRAGRRPRRPAILHLSRPHWDAALPQGRK